MPGAGENVATRRGGSRSAIARRADRLAGRVPANVARREKTALRCSHPGVRYDPANLVPDGGRDERCIRLQTHVDEDPFRRDRKSTRLNSSHLVISYAVFCLKKKKKRDEK